MKNHILYLALLLLGSLNLSAQESRRDRYVILISIDGFRPEFYLDSAWKAPTLQRLMRIGATRMLC